MERGKLNSVITLATSSWRRGTGLRSHEYSVRFESRVFRFTDHDMPVIRFAVHQKDRLADETAKVLKDAIWWPLHDHDAARYPVYY